MLVKLIEIYNKKTFASTADGKIEEFSLREVFVNPEHVVCMRENDKLKTKLSETPLGKDIHPAESYTKIIELLKLVRTIFYFLTIKML